MEKDGELKNNKNDLLASAAKSTVGIIPFAGPLLSELVESVIPNQRIDRLTRYVKELDKRLTEVDSESINKLKNNEDFIDLIEEGFVQAGRAISDERRKYIASVIKNGIQDESIELQESKYLLKILQELNDIEIIWLRFYLNPTMGGDEEFREKHKNVLQPVNSFAGADEETFKKSALQKSYKDHLERLSLIETKIKFDKKTGQPEFDKFTGKPKGSYSKTTKLGNMLLEQIELKTDEK